MTVTITKIQKDVSEAVKSTNNLSNQREIFKLRKQILKTWRGQLNKRKQLFWHGLNCENTSVIYETWLNQEKKVLPKKFLLKYIANECNEDRTIRQNTTLEKFRAEITLLKIRTRRHNNKVQQTDKEMNEFLDS